MTKMLSGANLPPIEALMDGDLQEWQGAPATTLGRSDFTLDPSCYTFTQTAEIFNKMQRWVLD